ncbi:hypothetical protein TRAPUB_11170 [Trametes pubescens]|uniref:Beta-lactamase-related domain-containing protein n=1 Tax=Trametes pubescens TaxID=154538 RepID=A0A1M2VXK2_TRAPU|nr:hypothetical protein TRAPUB_11170 [Trametes pubescens]
MITHSGGIPGFTTFTTFSPSSNLGLVVLINADEQAAHARAILKRAFDDVLGRAPPAQALDETPAEEPPTPLADASAGDPSSLDLSAYAGTYTSPGYGTLTLCTPTDPSPSCASVLADFAALGPVAPGLYGAYPRVFATHVRLTPLACDSHTFALTLTALFPHGYGADTSAFELWETGESEARVEFAVGPGPEGGQVAVAGFALFIDDEAVEARRRRTGGGEREAADAWFAKM